MVTTRRDWLESSQVAVRAYTCKSRKARIGGPGGGGGGGGRGGGRGAGVKGAVWGAVSARRVKHGSIV